MGGAFIIGRGTALGGGLYYFDICTFYSDEPWCDWKTCDAIYCTYDSVIRVRIEWGNMRRQLIYFHKKEGSKTRRKWPYRVMVCLLLFLLIGIIALHVDTVGDVRYNQTALGEFLVAHLRSRELLELGYFEDIESAMASIEKHPMQMEEEIIRFEEEPYLLAIFPSVIANPLFFHPPDTNIFFLLFREEKGMLHFLTLWAQGANALPWDHRGQWEAEDRIARDIVFAYVFGEITARVNGGVPIYYGVGVGPPPMRLSILGYEPDAIIPFTYRDEAYFFWYFRNASHFSEVFSANIDIERSFALGEIIALFDVQVVR